MSKQGRLLEEQIIALPMEKQDEFWDLLFEAIMWRGWDSHAAIAPGSGTGGRYARQFVDETCRLLAENGHEYDQYT
jgi:hypothetical protein